MDVAIECICPPGADGEAPHASDTVTLLDVLDFRRTITVRQSIRLATQTADGLSLPELTAVMAEAYLLHCITAWTLVDEKGKALPVTKAAVRDYLLSNVDVAEKVGDAADDLYSEKVVLPLLTRASASSPDTSTNGSTSPTSGHGSKRRTPSKRSSTSTTPMAAIVPMAASPAGGSS